MRFGRSSLEPESSPIPPAGRRGGPVGLHRWPALAGAAVALVLALIGVLVGGVFQNSGISADDASHASPAAHRSGGSAARSAGAASRPATSSTAPKPGNAPKAAKTSRSSNAARSASASKAGSGHTGTGAAAKVRTKALRTSCGSVAHIGDSTTLDLISPTNLPDPAQRLAARYADVGVRHVWVDASGGRSIVETMPGQVNGYNVARAWRAEGYRGCWVFALGTNDTANVSVGSARTVGLMSRINEMMSVAHGEPVMWVNTRTMLSSGPWSEANEQAWDSTLHQALARYPNMAIFNWAAVAQPGWFLPDGIHYSSFGCAARARAIADALARAFPRSGHSHGHVVT
jgi:hypothetical protein